MGCACLPALALLLLGSFLRGCLARGSIVMATTLAEHRAAVISEACRGLHEAYSELHANILSGKEPQRYLLFVSPPSGIADRLAGMVTAFLIALLTRRALLLAPYPMPYELLYDQPFINWTVPAQLTAADLGPVMWPPDPVACSACGDPAGGGSDPGLAASARAAGERSGLRCPVCADGGRSTAYQNWVNVEGAAEWHRRQDFRAFFPAVHTVIYASNRGASVALFHNPHHVRQLASLGLRPSSAFGCAANYLLFPRADTLEAVAAEMRELRAAPLVIGIQIRAGDRYMEEQDMHQVFTEKYRRHTRCAEALEAALGLRANASVPSPAPADAASPTPPPALAARWYVVSDSLSVRKAVQSWYGNKTIVHVRSRPAHVSTSGAGDLERSRLAAAEHWLFGMTDYQVISWHSGYGRTAAMRGLHEMSIWGVRWDQPYECGLAGVEATQQSGQAVSGLRRRARGRRRRRGR